MQQGIAPNHADHHSPEQPQKLTGSFWAVATHFNPARYENRTLNFRIFRDRLRTQGIPLLAVEAAVGEAPFDLCPDDGDLLIQRRCHSVLWQKERLFNLALEHLPVDCDKVVFLDADVLFMDAEWVPKVSSLLERYVAVQPFDTMYDLPPHASGFLREPFGVAWDGMAARWYQCPDPSSFVISGAPGGAMALRRSFIAKHRFYDCEILGGGDSAFFGALIGTMPNRNKQLFRHTQAVFRHMTPWAEAIFREARGSVGFLSSTLHHLWHGDRSKRYYFTRMFLASDYDPTEDVCVGEGECLEWCTEKPELHERVKSYFYARDEDSTSPSPTPEGIGIQSLNHSLESEAVRTVAICRQQHSAEQTLGVLHEEMMHLKRLAQEYRAVQETVTYRFARSLNACSELLLPRGSRLRTFVIRWARKL
ncbi:MAG: hypothetical protein V1926_01275 [Candidatus Peregrinibacteria bacterium]